MCVCVFDPSKAQARCHRIGQNKAVKVYRLITRNSYEREMFDRASLKLGLDKAVLQSMSGRDNSLGGAPGGGVSLTISQQELKHTGGNKTLQLWRLCPIIINCYYYYCLKRAVCL